MKQSAPTQENSSPDSDLLKEIGDATMERLAKEFGLKPKKEKPSTPAGSKPKKPRK